MNRKEELEEFIKSCCLESAIYYDGRFQAIKYLCGMGMLVYVERSRMLDYCETNIPNYNGAVDEPLIQQLTTEGNTIRGCESHGYRDCHYTITFMLK